MSDDQQKFTTGIACRSAIALSSARVTADCLAAVLRFGRFFARRCRAVDGDGDRVMVGEEYDQ